MNVIEFKRRFLKTQPRIQHVHVEDVDEAAVDHVHVEKSVLADVLKQFYRWFCGGEVCACFSCQCSTHKKFHTQRGFSRTARPGCKNGGPVGYTTPENLVQPMDARYASVSCVNAGGLHGDQTRGEAAG